MLDKKNEFIWLDFLNSNSLLSVLKGQSQVVDAIKKNLKTYLELLELLGGLFHLLALIFFRKT